MRSWLLGFGLTILVCSITGQDSRKFVKVDRRQSFQIYPWRHSDYFLVEIYEEHRRRSLTIKVKSDKFVKGQGFYKLGGPGVDQEPKGLFEINEIKGEIVNINPVNTEEHSELIMQVWAESASGEILENPVPLKIAIKDIKRLFDNAYKSRNILSIRELSPLTGSVCKNRRELTSGLVLTAADEDLPSHPGPFSFEIPEVSKADWTVTRVNDTHAVLQPRVHLQPGVYQVTVMVSDSGTLPSSAKVSVTLCDCDSSGHCLTETTQRSVLETGLIILTISIVSLILVTPGLFMLVLCCSSAVNWCNRQEDENPLVVMELTSFSEGQVNPGQDEDVMAEDSV